MQSGGTQQSGSQPQRENTPSAGESSIQDLLGGLPDGTDQDESIQALLDSYRADSGYAGSQESEYQKRLKTEQSRLDATTAVYGDILTQTRQAGQAEQGSNRAQQARGGRLGSDFGAAETSTIQNAGLARESIVENRKALALENIYADIDKTANDEFKRKEAAKQAG